MISKSATQKKFGYKNLISIAIQVIILGLLAYYLYRNQDIFSSLKNIHGLQIVWIVLLETGSFFVSSLLNYSMIHRLDKNVSFIDCFMLQYINNLLNKILPTIGGGAAFRAIYLKKKYQFPYLQFTSTVAGLYVISFFSTSLIGIFCLLFIYAQIKVFNWIIFLSFLSILAATLFIMLFSPPIPQSDRRVIKLLKSIVEGWNIIKKEFRLIFFYTLFSITLLILSTLNNMVIYQALGVKTYLVPMLFLSTLGIILAFLNFTPDGIGVKEGIYIYSTNLVQIPGGILILGSLILRAISILTTFIVGGICYWVIMRQIKILDSNGTDAVRDRKMT